MRLWILGLAGLLALPIARPQYLQQQAVELTAPAAWLPADPADSLYRVAREALNRQQFSKAAELFAEIGRKYPRSGYVADALYWEAFARYRTGSDSELRLALERLQRQRSRFPTASTHGDAEALTTRIQGELAKRGDAAASESIYASAGTAAEPGVPPVPPVGGVSPGVAVGGRAPRPPREIRVTRDGRDDRDDCDDDSDVKLAALNAVLQMDASRAMPLLTRVLARRDAGSVCLRRKAVFLVAQQETDSTEEILLRAARNDPDGQVREQAVFWLSQVSSPRAIAALDSIARHSTDPELQDKAVFALSQQSDPAATRALRDIAEMKGMSSGIREKAIFWLGQSGAGGSAYLKSLYDRLDNDDLREKVIFGVSQSGKPEDTRWLLDLARSEKSSVELRKKAIFWSAQGGASANELGALYTGLKDRELREQTIFALSQLDDSSVVDRLIDIAKKDPDPDMRKKALFWLGQRNDPRVADLLEQILSE